MINLKILNQIILWILIVLCILTLSGLFNFGHGLGNIFFFPPIILATVVHFFVTRILTRKSNNNYWLLIISICTLICIGIIYKATIGRGPEFSWNGEIFSN